MIDQSVSWCLLECVSYFFLDIGVCVAYCLSEKLSLSDKVLARILNVPSKDFKRACSRQDLQNF